MSNHWHPSFCFYIGTSELHLRRLFFRKVFFSKKKAKDACWINNLVVILHRKRETSMHALLAQLVEQLTLNQWVLGSNP